MLNLILPLKLGEAVASRMSHLLGQIKGMEVQTKSALASTSQGAPRRSFYDAFVGSLCADPLAMPVH